jgi:hypothetical protein
MIDDDRVTELERLRLRVGELERVLEGRPPSRTTR